MNRAVVMWAGFAACVLTALAALAYVSVMVVQMDRREAAATRRAALEENVRLALWRLDAALTPLLARENARPYEVYQPFYAVQGAMTQQMTPLGYGQVLLPSPLRRDAPPMVRLHFQLDPVTGEITTPYEAARELPPLDELAKRVTAQRVIAAAGAAAEAVAIAGDEGAADSDLSAIPQGAPAPVAPPTPAQQAQVDDAQQQQQVPAYQQLESRNTYTQQQAISEREFQQRVKSQALSNEMIKGGRAMPAPDGPPPAAAPSATAASATQGVLMKADVVIPSHVLEGPMTPAWIEGELFLLRHVSVDGRALIQGVWLDWPRIEPWLRAEITDLLPEAKLRAAEEGPEELEGRQAEGNLPEMRMMASAPIVLALGAAPGGALAVSPPIRNSLIVAWIGMALAVIAVTALLRGAMVLSERRGAFVSAVTHELRTPLTTFRLYTQMLADGMVVDEAKRQSYLRTLSTEAERLSHLVENVLTYARLERAAVPGTRRGDHQRLSVGDLIGRMTDRLAQRCDQARMQLIVEVGPDAGAAMLRTDVAAVERIVFNLVDNACKYARDADDRRVQLSAERRDGRVMIRVHDHGPGIAPDAAKRMFRPFSKSAQAAAHSAPGVGLGLALSRRLACSLGGDLKLESSNGEGTCFTLTLPAASLT